MALLALAVLVILGLAGWPGTPAVAGPDCEGLQDGLLAQPVAAWTSLAFVPVGVWAAGHRPMQPALAGLFAAAFVAVGLASFAGHAAATTWARDMDSLAIKAMLVVFVTYPLLRRRALPPRTAALLTGSVVAMAWIIELAIPATARPLLVVLAAAAVIATIIDGDRSTVGAGLALLGAGALVWTLGRSGGPLCDPGAILQLHGMWHILAAIGFLTIYRGITWRPTQS